MVKKLLERFTKNNCRKTNQTEFRIEKISKKKSDKLLSNGKAMLILLTDELIKKVLLHKII